MKRLYALLLSVLLVSAGDVVAQQTGNLYIHNRAGMWFVASLNGQLVNATQYKDLLIEGLRPGDYDLHLSIFHGEGGSTLEQKVTVNRGQESSYEIVIGRRSGTARLAFDGAILINQTRHSERTPYWQAERDGDRHYRFGWRGFGRDQTGHPRERERQTQDDGGQDKDKDVAPETPNYGRGQSRCGQPMSQAAFSTALTRIQGRPTESAKYAIAKDEVERAGCITSAQALELMKALALTNSKLNLGKIAWHHVSDPENFHVVYDAFSLGAQIEQMRAYQRQHPYGTDPGAIGQPTPEPEPEKKDEEPDHYVMPGYSGYIGCPWPIEDGQFRGLLRSLNQQSFESSKVTMLKQAGRQHCFFVSQVIELCKLFSFDNSRLDMAKFLFDYTYDQSNYHQVSEVFSFSSSTDDLMRFISTKQ